MADDGNEGALELIGLPEAGDIADGGNDVKQLPFGGDQRGIGDAHRQVGLSGAFKVALHVELGMWRQGPPPRLRLFEGEPLRRAGKLDDIIVLFGSHSFFLDIQQA